jgi:hypothetical protein
MFYRQAIKAPQLLTNRTCNVIEMISRGEQWSDMCRLTLTPPKDLLAFYRPLLSASFRTNQLRAWLYEDEALTRKPAARMELQIIEWRPVTTVNSSDSTNGTNCIIKKISSRSRSADYPQHVGVLFNKHSNYSAYIQWKQNQLLPSNLVEDGLPFVLFIELPSHCLMEHAQCVRGECDQQTGLCRCDQGFDGVTCSQPAQPANGRKPWPLFRSFPQWYYKSIFAVVVGVGLHGLLYLIAGHVWFRLTRWWRRRRSSVEFL